MPTLNEVRQLVGRLTQRGFVVGDGQGVALGTTSTFIDSLRLVDTTRGTDFYVRGWLVRTTKTDTTRVRKIGAYDPTTGTLTVTPAWGVAPAALETYEVWPSWHPEEVEQAIIRAQRHMYALLDATVPGVANQRQYNLTTAETWLTRPQQVAQIEIRDGATTNQWQWPTLPTNRVRQAVTAGGSSVVLDLRGAPLGTGDIVVVRAWGTLDAITPLTSPTSSTVAPIDWLAWEAIYEHISTPGRNLDDDLRRRAVQEVKRHREANTPNVPQPLYDEAAPWGWGGRGYL